MKTHTETGESSTCGNCILLQDIQLLNVQINQLNNHRHLNRLGSYWKMLCWNFVQGTARGLGAAIGATVVVTMIASILTAMDWIPIVGTLLDNFSIELSPDKQ